MSTIKRADGDNVQIVAGGTYASDTPEQIGMLFGVPVTDATSGLNVAIATEGVFALPKDGTSGPVFALGDKVYWNATSNLCTATTTDALIGVCVKAAGTNEATVHTRINGQVASALDGLAMNLAATTAPAVDDDTADGYGVGSLWFDTTADLAYVCLDASAGAAVWLCVTPKVLAGTATILAGGSAITATVGAAYDNKPVTVTIKGLTGGTGAFHATDPIVLKASVAAGTLTITAINAITAVATNVASNVVCYYTIAGQ